MYHGGPHYCCGVRDGMRSDPIVERRYVVERCSRTDHHGCFQEAA